MSDDTIPGPSEEGSPQGSRKGRRIGVLLCAVSAIVTLATVVLIVGRLFFSGAGEVATTGTGELPEIAPAAGTQPKN